MKTLDLFGVDIDKPTFEKIRSLGKFLANASDAELEKYMGENSVVWVDITLHAPHRCNDYFDRQGAPIVTHGQAHFRLKLYCVLEDVTSDVKPKIDPRLAGFEK